MPSYESFSYEESLTDRGRDKLQDSLIVENNPAELLLILRVLSGSLNLTHKYSGRKITVRTNYFSNDFKSFGQAWRTKFPKILSDDISSQDLAIYIEASKYKNINFYKNILSEISHYAFMTNKGSHTASFVFIYRLLEKISYAFPLIYTSKSQDFLKTFSQLKKLMTGDADKKELGFFKKFIEELYRGESISETSVDIYVNANTVNAQVVIFNEIKRVCDDNIIHEDTDDPRKISINFCDMGAFIITIRNRFFHNLNDSASNIESSKIIDSDLLFSFINPMAMQWLSSVFLTIFLFNLEEFEKNRN